jgi:hypothetical protein
VKLKEGGYSWEDAFIGTKILLSPHCSATNNNSHMMHQFPPSSSVSSAKLVAINSAVVAIRETAAAAEDDPVEKKEHSESSVKQDQQLFTKYSDKLMKPDIGILSKDFLKNKGREPLKKQFAIRRKKRAAAVDVDVGILSSTGRRQQQISRANLNAMNEVAGRSLQSEVLPDMCPTKNNNWPGWFHFDSLFNVTDSFFFTKEGYFPKCSCPNPTTCGPNLCECLELDADGDILQCMDPFKQLCQGTQYIDGSPGPWSMEQCLGNKFGALAYCSMLPCFVDGGSWSQCSCEWDERRCTGYRLPFDCARSKCCQAQTDDEGREACIDGGLHENYYDQVTSFSISDEEMISRFNECSINSDSNKSIVQCCCKSFSYGKCVNDGLRSPDMCEAMNCCYEQTEDDARLDCFSRFRGGSTGLEFHRARDAIQERCIASGKSSDQCKCDIQGLSNCVRGIDVFNIEEEVLQEYEPSCDLFKCCQVETDDEGRKDCLLQDEAELMYGRCLSDGNTTESCFCDKSNTLCSSEYSDNQQCELSSCCREQSDDIGRKECIGNFTTSQPSSAPSKESLPPTMLLLHLLRRPTVRILVYLGRRKYTKLC